MTLEIILIGPMSAGKSTVGKLLSEKLNIPQRSMDDLRWDYYAEIGFNEAAQKEIADKEGTAGLLRYWKPFEAHAVERILSDFEDCIFDFGAGHSVYEDEALFARVEKALAPYPYVILLLPSADQDATLRILQERFEQAHALNIVTEAFNPFEQFVRHSSNERLAKYTVYTENKTPDETCAEILALINKAD